VALSGAGHPPASGSFAPVAGHYMYSFVRTTQPMHTYTPFQSLSEVNLQVRKQNEDALLHQAARMRRKLQQ
jgi:hypothetical protein